MFSRKSHYNDEVIFKKIEIIYGSAGFSLGENLGKSPESVCVMTKDTPKKELQITTVSNYAKHIC